MSDPADVFVKERVDGLAACEAEAAGLRWLGQSGAVRVPKVHELGTGPPAWIALERLGSGSLSHAGAEDLGRGIAQMHAAGADAFGAVPPGSPDRAVRLGLVELELEERPTWAEFYAAVIVAPLAGMAQKAGALSSEGAATIDSVCGRMVELAGAEELPARLHGDLWNGNVFPLADGSAALIDPAAYGGHREMDLAMLRLFGTPSERIFAAYEEVWPVQDGHADRVELWQLAPLLVHAILFGGSYGASAARAARRYL